MQIDVQPAETAAAAGAAAELARLLRQAVGRLEAACPAGSGPRALSAWASTWATLRAGLLGLAASADEVAAVSAAAVARYRETESGVIEPDGP